MDSFVVVLIPIILTLLIGFRIAAGGMDKGRVREYVESRGGQILALSWAPFGPGWFGEKSDRIYEVHYLDRDGNEHHAHCKTSLWTGVYFTEDTIVHYAEQSSARRETLEEENQRLRAEIARLKGTDTGYYRPEH